MYRRSLIAMLVVTAAWGGPLTASADHPAPHDPRANPNCAWDSTRSADWDNDGEPDHMIIGLAHNTSFPRQVVVLLEPLTGMDHIPPFFGSDEGPDNATVVVQGDHRMLGANPAHTDDGDPEQQHNGAIYAHVDYDDIERGRSPRAEWGAGIYEANHLVMACGSSDGTPEAAACLAGNEVYRMTDEGCPED